MVVPHRYVVARPGWNATLQVSVVVGLVVVVNIIVVVVLLVVVMVVVNIMVMAMMVGANITNTKAFQHFVTLAQEKIVMILHINGFTPKSILERAENESFSVLVPKA